MASLEEISSPAAMIAQRFTAEGMAEKAFVAAASALSSHIVTFAMDSTTLPSPADTQQVWNDAAYATLERENLSIAEFEWLYREVSADTMPGEMYDTAAAIIMDAVVNSYSKPMFEDKLREAMDLDGGDVQQIADALTAALKFFGTSWRKRIKRKARTIGTRMAGWTVFTGLMVLGVPHKRWVTRRDNRVRDSHAAIDGMTIKTNELFPVGGYSLEYPGESSGPPEEVINCRCVLTAVLRP